VHDGNGHSLKIEVAHFDGKGFGDTAAETEEQPDKEPVSEAGNLILDKFYITRLKIGLHAHVLRYPGYRGG